MASANVLKAIKNLKRASRTLADPSKIRGLKSAAKKAKKAVKKKLKKK